MKIQGTPNMVVQTRKMTFGNKFAVVPLFKFDENGCAEIDETKFSQTDLSKITTLFKLNEQSEDDIRQMAKEKGIKSWHVKSIETLKKELGV